MRQETLVESLREMRNALKILAGVAKGKRPFGRRRRRWQGNIIKMDGGQYIQLLVAVNTVMNLRVPQKTGNFLASW